MPRSEIQENQAKDSDFLSEAEFDAAKSSTTPVTPDDAAGAAGVSSDVSRADHKHPEHAFTPTSDQNDAMDNAASPTAANPFATVADVPTVTQTRQVLSTFVPSSPSGEFNIYGDAATSFLPHTDLTLLDLQFQLQQGNAAQLECRVQLVKWDFGTSAEIIIFDLQTTVSGSNNDFRDFFTSTVVNPGEEVMDVTAGDRLNLRVSNIAQVTGPKQTSFLTVTFSFDPS